MIEGQVLQVPGIARDDVHDEIVAAGDQMSGTDLRAFDYLVEEAVDVGALVLCQLDHQQGFEPDPKRPRIDLGMGAGQHPLAPQPAQPVMHAGWGEMNRRGDLLDGQPRIVLQQAQDLGVYSVDSAVGQHFP